MTRANSFPFIQVNYLMSSLNQMVPFPLSFEEGRVHPDKALLGSSLPVWLQQALTSHVRNLPVHLSLLVSDDVLISDLFLVCFLPFILNHWSWCFSLSWRFHVPRLQITWLSSSLCLNHAFKNSLPSQPSHVWTIPPRTHPPPNSASPS